MKKILITGGLGFVGGRLCRSLATANEVWVSGRKPPDAGQLALLGNPGFIAHQDLLTAEGFPRGIDSVIHLAALNEWDSVQHPSEAIRVNIDQTRLILENSIARSVTQFIYFSTAHIYGSPLTGNITEATLPRPQHPYAITHRAAEDYVAAAGLQKKLQAVVLRLSNSFGAPVLPTVNRWTLLANDLCRQAVEKGKLQLLSNGCQYRDFISLSDVELALKEITGSTRFDQITYNFGSGIGCKVIDFARMVQEQYRLLTGHSLPLDLPPGSQPSEEPDLHFSIDRLLAAGVKPANDWAREINSLLAFCQQYFLKA